MYARIRSEGPARTRGDTVSTGQRALAHHLKLHFFAYRSATYVPHETKKSATHRVAPGGLKRFEVRALPELAGIPLRRSAFARAINSFYPRNPVSKGEPCATTRGGATACCGAWEATAGARSRWFLSRDMGVSDSAPPTTPKALKTKKRHPSGSAWRSEAIRSEGFSPNSRGYLSAQRYRASNQLVLSPQPYFQR